MLTGRCWGEWGSRPRERTSSGKLPVSNTRPRTERQVAILKKILRAIKSLLMSLVNLLLLPVRLLSSLLRPKRKSTKGVKKRPR